MKYFFLIVLLVIFFLPSIVEAFDDATPMFKTWLFGNIYQTKMRSDPAGNQWFAEHYDFIGNADHDATFWDSLLYFNPAIEGAVYTNLTELGNRDARIQNFEYDTIARIYGDSGVSIEEAFLHFGDLEVWQTLASGQRYLNIDSLKIAGNDSATRGSERDWYNTDASPYYPAGDGNWFTNFTLPFYREQRAVTMVLIQDAQDILWRNVAAGWNVDGATPLGFNYRYIDNSIIENKLAILTPGYWLQGSNRIDSTFGGATGGTGIGDTSAVLSDMDTDEFPSLSTEFTNFFQPKIDLLLEVNDSLVAAGYGGCWPNLSYTVDSIVAQLAAGGLSAAVYETRGDGAVLGSWTSFGVPGGIQALASRNDTARIENPTMLQMEEYRFGGSYTNPTHTVTDTVVANSPFSGRLFKAALASFLWLYNPTYDYFHFGKSDSKYWWKLHGVDIGTPSSAGTVDSTLTDIDGNLNQVLCFREFSKGMVIFRPLATEADTDTTAATAIEYVLDEEMWYIDENLDSTLVGPTIFIKAQTGWILGDKEQGPTITNVVPTSAYLDSTEAVGATISDDYRLNTIDVNIITPTPTTIDLWDTTFATAVTEYSATHDYLFDIEGFYSIIHVVTDDSGHTTYDTLTFDVDPHLPNAILPTLGVMEDDIVDKIDTIAYSMTGSNDFVSDVCSLSLDDGVTFTVEVDTHGSLPAESIFVWTPGESDASPTCKFKVSVISDDPTYGNRTFSTTSNSFVYTWVDTTIGYLGAHNHTRGGLRQISGWITYTKFLIPSVIDGVIPIDSGWMMLNSNFVAGDTAYIVIRSDNVGQPGGLIAVSDSVVTTVGGDIMDTLTASFPITVYLEANTSYWIGTWVFPDLVFGVRPAYADTTAIISYRSTETTRPMPDAWGGGSIIYSTMDAARAWFHVTPTEISTDRIRFKEGIKLKSGVRIK